MIKVVRVRPGGKHCRRFQPLAFARTLRITVIGLVAVGFVVTGWGPPTIRPAGAASPDPLPAYSHSRRLRQESRLHGIAAAGRVVLAVGDRGTILRSVDAGQTWETAESRTDAALESVAIDAAGKAVIVGGGYDRVTGISRGVVLVSDDAGRSWTRGACEDLPKLHSVRHDAGDRRFQAVGNFSFADLTDRFESFDGGRRWQGAQAASGPPGGGGAGTSVSPATSRNRLSDWAAATPIRSAVRTVCQNPSDSVVFAAGDHGVILRRARDEEDWSVAHGNGRTSSVLIVTSSPGRTPWQLIGSEALEMRQRVSVLWWDLLDSTTPPQDPQRPPGTIGPEKKTAIDRMHQAVAMLGGDGVDYDAVRSNADVDTAVRQWLAIHSPLVVVIDRELPEAFRLRLTRAAIAAGVLRIVGYRYGRSGDTLMHENALLPTLGVLASDLRQDAMMFSGATTRDATSGLAESTSTGNRLALRWLYDARGDLTLGGSITSGLPLQAGHRRQAELPPASRRDLQIAQARLTLKVNLEKVLRLNADPNDVDRRQPPASIDSVAVGAAITGLLAQIDSADQLRVVFDLLQQTERARRATRLRDPDGGAATRLDQIHQMLLKRLAEDFHHHSLGRWADVRWKAKLSSAENRSLLAAVSQPFATNDSRAEGVKPAVDVVPVSPFQIGLPNGGGESSPRPASASPFQIQKSVFRQSLPRSPSLGGAATLQALMNPAAGSSNASSPAGTDDSRDADLQWEFHPLRLLARRSAKAWQETTPGEADDAAIVATGAEASLSGGASGNSNELTRLAQSAGAGAWSALLSSGDRDVIAAAFTDQPPRLDGKLDDACWRSQPPRRAGGETLVQLSFDEQYLYVAARCPRLPSERPAEAPVQDRVRRIRDHDLTGVEHLRLRLDVDRDLLTSYEFCLNADRMARDTVDGDPAWQPTWYFASHQNGDATTYEIAILRDDLSQAAFAAESRWFVSARQITANDQRQDSWLPRPEAWAPLRLLAPPPAVRQIGR